MVHNAVTICSASKSYASGTTVALENVDLAIRPGTFVSLIGPSGCGKSTLLRLIAGLESPDAGTVRVHGATPAQASAAKLIGLVPQTPALLPWLSVLGNVSLPHRVNRRSNARRTEFDGLTDRSGTPPNMPELLARAGLGEVMDKKPAELSGGMQQRAAIVRAFGLQPDLLLMDEPFSALDEFTREALQDQLLDLWDELRTTVVFVTHSVSEAVRLSDAVVVMAPNPGRIVDVIDIDLPRPRNEKLFVDKHFHHYEGVLRQRLRSAWHSSDVA